MNLSELTELRAQIAALEARIAALEAQKKPATLTLPNRPQAA